MIGSERMPKDEIIRLLQAIADKNVNGFNEENVKIHVVIRLLEAVGHRDNLDLEHSYGTNRPDIILKGFEQPILIEVKGANENLISHIPQIQNYSYTLNSCLSVLTNGNLFYFFSPFWRRKSFEERLILLFSLKDLRNEEITEKVISLLDRDLNFNQVSKNIEQMENEISNKEKEINEKESKISDLKNELESLKETYPKIEQLKEHIEHLEPNIKSKIEKYLQLKEEINNLNNEISSLEKQIPFIPQDELSKTDLTRRIKTGPYEHPSKSTENFSWGISDEVINIKALQNGKQIILCKTQEKKNNYIFLLPKTSFKSDFTPSEIGRKLMVGPIEKETTKYVAKIEYLSIPGKDKKFWQELYEEQEFNLWVIDEGPWKYFTRSSKHKMLLWIFRVYEMPFEIKVGMDFTRHMTSAKLTNQGTLKRIQSGFDNSEFTAVLTDDEFEKRKKKITEIARKYS
jgi:predicted type IV restriction endonuclease